MVVWNAVHVAPPVDQTRARRFLAPVVYRRQGRNSLNNRFRPDDAITTECVVNMDDDWDMPEPAVSYAVRVWHNGFRSRLVGLQKNARTHAAVPGAGTWQYTTAPGAPQSIVLPSGMVYHRDYLHMCVGPCACLPAETRAPRTSLPKCVSGHSHDFPLPASLALSLIPRAAPRRDRARHASARAHTTLIPCPLYLPKSGARDPSSRLGYGHGLVLMSASVAAVGVRVGVFRHG